jgi:hypothetical protein
VNLEFKSNEKMPKINKPKVQIVYHTIPLFSTIFKNI